jgi:hypothetical protein
MVSIMTSLKVSANFHAITTAFLKSVQKLYDFFVGLIFEGIDHSGHLVRG